MSHKAQQIIEAIAGQLEAFISEPVNIYQHRANSLADDFDELPAISVDFGEDAPFDADGAAGFDMIQSVLTVNATAIVTGDGARGSPKLAASYSPRHYGNADAAARLAGRSQRKLWRRGTAGTVIRGRRLSRRARLCLGRHVPDRHK